MTMPTAAVRAEGVGLGLGIAAAGAGFALIFLSGAVDRTIPEETAKDPIKPLMDKGFLTEEQVKAAAQKGIDDLVAVASQQFPSTANGLPVDPHAAAREAVEVYLAGDKSKPPVIAVPAP